MRDGLRADSVPKRSTVLGTTCGRVEIACRDYLRNRQDAAAAYRGLKQELARQYPNDTVRCTEGKTQFIEGILQRALSWSALW
jgi:GrpB-like predicted nucleotidyltransferase (UPF0157 family)